MAGVTQYVLSGGPCDGNTGQLTPAIEQSGQLTCSGHIYKITSPVQNQGGREVFKDAGPVPAPKPTGGAPRTHSGWQDLRNSVNHNFPAALRASEKSTAAALRSLSRGRKVRG